MLLLARTLLLLFIISSIADRKSSLVLFALLACLALAIYVYIYIRILYIPMLGTKIYSYAYSVYINRISGKLTATINNLINFLRG